ncbi:MAG: hypothetical protein LBS62_02805 [Clostridiales bacterium]|jgi:uncharacterized protein YuzB (UPF0349 family)|nr:hypothetical protein [Clostridiales bacterium]
MSAAKKIKICKKCSGLDVKELKEALDPKDYSLGCIQKCLSKNAELGGKIFGMINGNFVVCDTKEEFLAEAKIAATG